MKATASCAHTAVARTAPLIAYVGAVVAHVAAMATCVVAEVSRTHHFESTSESNENGEAF